MAIFDDETPFGAEPRKPAARHDIGQPLDQLSLSELRERIDLLKAEMARLEAQIAVKDASRRAADTVFRI